MTFGKRKKSLHGKPLRKKNRPRRTKNEVLVEVWILDLVKRLDDWGYSATFDPDTADSFMMLKKYMKAAKAYRKVRR